MSRINLIFYCCCCLLNAAVLTGQAPPKNKTLTNVVGYQLYQQKQWSENQLPKNSMQYKTNFKYQTPRDLTLVVPDLQLRQIPLPDVNRNFLSASPTTLPGLNSNFSGNGVGYYKWQKLSWWKYLPDRNE